MRIESTGLVKMDFLGLKTLSEIKNALLNIKYSRGIDINLDEIPIDDPNTFELYQQGNTIGVFQFESSSMLPMETTILADKGTEDLFYLKYASHQLQLFANKPKQESVEKTEKKRNKKPRLEKGPIIVSLDTSGAMSGKPEKVARCLW